MLKDFVLLASDTTRTKAYLSMMIRENKLPGMCIVYSDDIVGMQEKAIIQEKKSIRNNKYFDADRSILSYIQEAGIPYIFVEDKDINSEQMKTAIWNMKQKYFIYSGYGGYILKPHLFQLGKKFIHVHAGILPEYRGSTTVYYSILREKKIGATAIFLSEGIDEGEIINFDVFELPKEQVDIDYIFEPYIRSRVLMKTIETYLSEGKFLTCEQSMEDAETYFIIHPVLKHIALLEIKKEQGNK